MSIHCKLIGELKAIFLFIIAALCLLGYALHYHSNLKGVFSFIEVPFLRFDLQWLFFIYVAVWCLSLIALTFNWKDVFLIGLLLIVGIFYADNYASAFRPGSAIVLLAGITLGKAASFLLKPSQQFYFTLGLILLLALTSWVHLDLSMTGGYHGPRWTGVWDNPNIYGMLMGAGLLLAMGLSGLGRANNVASMIPNRMPVFQVVVFIAAGVMAVGLLFSHSRGAWVGTTVGLLYLANVCGKLKWRFVLSGVFVVLLVLCFFWHSTSDADAWYLQRLDLSRPSAQHRISAWCGAAEMIMDHPLGVGWNKAVGIYEKSYSPPENGAGALTVNSYLMMGTELGVPGLFFFMAYVVFCFLKNRTPPDPVHGHSASNLMGEGGIVCPGNEEKVKAACRAGGLALLVMFWFDGGLFTLATASMFWILLELGAGSSKPS